MKKEYVVTITETSKMSVCVEAESQLEAEQIVSDKWKEGEYVLDADHFADVDFEAEDTVPKQEMTYAELSSLFRTVNDRHLEPIVGYIVFTAESFDRPYNQEARTYAISSNNKAYQSGMGGYSIYGSCLDGSDPCLRMDGYMRADDGWKIEKCYMKKDEYDRLQNDLAQQKTPEPRLPER